MNPGELVQEEVTNFPVKCISGVKKEDHYVHFQVHWSPSWEREDGLVGCEDLIELFKFQEKNEIYGHQVYKDGDSRDHIENSSASSKRSNLQDKRVSSSSSPRTKKKTSGSFVRKNLPGKMPEWTGEGEMKNSLSSVHNITGIFQGKDDCTYYKVEWTPTWEKEDNLVGCGSLIRQFFEVELRMDLPAALLGEGRREIMEGHDRLPMTFEIKQEPLSPRSQDGEDQLYGDQFLDSTVDSAATDASGDGIEHLKEENKTLKSQYNELQKNFEEYGTEREASLRMLSEKNDNLRETIDKYQTQKGNEVSMLIKKNEVIEEKFDNYKKEKESEIEILLERNKDVREKYNKHKVESAHDTGILQKKCGEIRQKLEIAKNDRENDVRILMERNNDMTDKFDTHKTESSHEIGVLTKKCEELLLKFDQNAREKTFEVKLLQEKNEEQRDLFENYRVDKEKECVMTSKKIEDFKGRLDNLKKQKENEVKVLTKRIEERRDTFEKYKTQKETEIATHVKKNEEIKEKFDYYKNQKETEVSQLQKSKEEIIEWVDSHKSAKESDLIAMKKKFEETSDTLDHYRRKKENEIDNLEKKNDELTKRFNHYKSEKQSEIGMLLKKSEAASEQMCNYRSEKENEIHTLIKKAEDLMSRYELDKTEKDKENGLLLKKNEDLKERFDNYKNEKDNEILVLVNKNEDLRERFQRFEKEKDKEIRMLAKQVEGKFWKYDDVKKEEIDDSAWQDLETFDVKTRNNVENKTSIDIFAKNDDAKVSSSYRGKKEIEIGMLLKKSEDLRQELENYKSEAKVEIGRLLTKIENMKGRFDAFKLAKEGDAGLLLKKNEALQKRFEEYKSEKEGEHAGLLKKVVSLHAKIRSHEEDMQNLMKENTDLKLQHGGDKKKLKRCEDEKENEISSITEEYGNLRKKYKAYKAEAVAENELLSEKVINLKEKYKGYKKEHEKDIDLLLKKIENQKEKFEKFEEKTEKEIAALTEKNEDIQEEHNTYKDEHENETEKLSKKIEDIKAKHEKYKSEKELLVELLVKQKDDMTKKQEGFASEKENELNLLTKKNTDIRKRYENHKNDAENEIERYMRKNQELTQKCEGYREEKDEEIKIYFKKHEELKEQFDSCKSEQEGQLKMLTKQCEDAKAVFELYQKRKETEIQNLYHWVCQKSNQLTESKTELAAEKIKINFILQNVDMQGTNSIILKDFSLINKVRPSKAVRSDVIEIADDVPVFNSCEILGEYFSEDIASLKGALKDKIVKIETMKSDIKDLAAKLNNDIEEKQRQTDVKDRQMQLMKIKEEINSDDYDPSEPTTISEDESEEVVDYYQGTSETLGGMYVSVLKKVGSCKRLNEYYKYIYAQELYTLNKGLTEKDESIKSLERNIKDNEFHIQVLQDEIKQFTNDVKTGSKELMAKLLESKPIERLQPPEETFELHNLMPTVSSGPQIKEFIEPTTSAYEEDDISLHSENSTSGVVDDTDSSIKYKVAGTASFFTREEMYLLFNNNNNAEESDDQQSYFKPPQIDSQGNIQNSGSGNKNKTSQRISGNSSRNKKSVEKAYNTIPYLKLHLKVNRGRHSACESCGDKCYRGVYLRGDMKLRLGKNPFQDSECVECFKRNNKRARRSSPDQSVDFRYEQKYDEWVNESSPERRLSQSPSKNNKLQREHNMNGPRCSRLNSQVREQSNRSPTEYIRDNTQNPNRVMAKKQYECQECPRSFNLHRTFRNHMVTHTERECDNHNDQQHSQHPSDTEMADNEDTFKCELCGKQFNRLWNLKSHMSTHDEENPTKNVDSAKSESEKESQDITFTCPECKKTLSWDVVLDGFLSIDSEEKDFKCHYCDFKFSPSNYKMKEGNQPDDQPTAENENEEKLPDTETAEKPHKCCLCNLQFENPDILKDHNRKIHALSSKDYMDHFKPHKDDVIDESVTSDKSVVEFVVEKRPPLNSTRIVEYNDNEEKRPAFNTDSNTERNVMYNAGRRPPFNPNRNTGYNPTNRSFRGPPSPRFSNNWQANRFNRNHSANSEMRPKPGPMRTPYNKHHDILPNACEDDGPRKKALHCYTCGKQFQFFHNLKIHARMHHTKDEVD